MKLSVIAKLTLDCNLACRYCYECKRPLVMSQEVIEATIRKCIGYNLRQADREPMALFYWHGGEPLLAGRETFERIYAIQNEFKGLLVVENAIQTNGTLLDEEWFRWLKDNDQGYGISLDGPGDLHDKNRRFMDGSGSFDRVIEALRKHPVHFGGSKPAAICVVTRDHLGREKELADFFEEHVGSFSLLPYFSTDKRRDDDFAPSPEQFGAFLINIFDLWSTGNYHVVIDNFYSLLSGFISGHTQDCHCQRSCTEILFSVEPNGDIFPCDRFPSTPEFRVGNILHDSVEAIFENKRSLGYAKREEDLDPKCQSCRWIDHCYGGCIYNAVALTGNFSGRDYYCESYLMFFEHVDKFIQEQIDAAEVAPLPV